MLPLLIQTPLPRDLQLPLPLESWALEIVLVLVFLGHILFVNLMLGGSLLTVFLEILGRSRPRYDALARRVAHTVTVNKSLAVVLGVGPLLAISLLYTTYFYSANALTGYGWISVIPLVSTAFLLAYLHKYTWERWSAAHKTAHVVLGAVPAFLLLCVPLIFLANINLMLFPEKWGEVRGFFSALGPGNVFPRYFHFLAASVAVAGLFLAGWFGRQSYPVKRVLPGFSRPELRRIFFSLAFWATSAQLVFGPLVLLTLPRQGVTAGLLYVVIGGVAFVGVVLYLLWRQVGTTENRIGRRYVGTIVVLSIVVLFMGTARHLYREASLTDHRQLVLDRTETFASVSAAARMRLAAGLSAGEALAAGPTGQSVFRNCAACHALDKVLAAPPLTEIYSLYKDNPDGIVAWAKNPAKKRPQFSPMPSFAHLGDQQLRLAADYILQVAAPRQ